MVIERKTIIQIALSSNQNEEIEKIVIKEDNTKYSIILHLIDLGIIKYKETNKNG